MRNICDKHRAFNIQYICIESKCKHFILCQQCLQLDKAHSKNHDIFIQPIQNVIQVQNKEFLKQSKHNLFKADNFSNKISSDYAELHQILQIRFQRDKQMLQEHEARQKQIYSNIMDYYFTQGEKSLQKIDAFNNSLLKFLKLSQKDAFLSQLACKQSFAEEQTSNIQRQIQNGVQQGISDYSLQLNNSKKTFQQAQQIGSSACEALCQDIDLENIFPELTFSQQGDNVEINEKVNASLSQQYESQLQNESPHQSAGKYQSAFDNLDVFGKMTSIGQIPSMHQSGTQNEGAIISHVISFELDVPLHQFDTQISTIQKCNEKQTFLATCGKDSKINLFAIDLSNPQAKSTHINHQFVKSIPDHSCWVFRLLFDQKNLVSGDIEGNIKVFKLSVIESASQNLHKLKDYHINKSPERQQLQYFPEFQLHLNKQTYYFQVQYSIIQRIDSIKNYLHQSIQIVCLERCLLTGSIFIAGRDNVLRVLIKQQNGDNQDAFHTGNFVSSFSPSKSFLKQQQQTILPKQVYIQQDQKIQDIDKDEQFWTIVVQTQNTQLSNNKAQLIFIGTIQGNILIIQYQSLEQLVLLKTLQKIHNDIIFDLKCQISDGSNINLYTLFSCSGDHTMKATELIISFAFGKENEKLMTCSISEQNSSSRQFIGHTGHVRCSLLQQSSSYSSSSKEDNENLMQLISCAEDGSIRIWDADTGRLIQTIKKAHAFASYWINRVMGYDDNIIVSVGEDLENESFIKIWK